MGEEQSQTTKLFQVYDLKAEALTGPIMAMGREGPAIREFHDALANKETYLGRHPEDYELWELGTLNLNTGEITSATERVVAGKDWKRAHEAVQGIPQADIERLKQRAEAENNTAR